MPSSRKRAINYRALLRKMTFADKSLLLSSPACSMRMHVNLSWKSLFIAKEPLSTGLFCGKSHFEDKASLLSSPPCSMRMHVNLEIESRQTFTCMSISHEDLIYTRHFSHKSHVVHGSFVKTDLQIKASYASSPPCSMRRMWISKKNHKTRKKILLFSTVRAWKCICMSNENSNFPNPRRHIFFPWTHANACKYWMEIPKLKKKMSFSPLWTHWEKELSAFVQKAHEAQALTYTIRVYTCMYTHWHLQT